MPQKDHAPSFAVAPCQGRTRPRPAPPTDDRALIERGRKDAAKIGAYMAGHALIPDRVLVSPAARCQETWKAACRRLQPAPAAVSAAKLYDATPQTILGVIKDAPAAAHSLLVIGHNPGLHELALMLIASGDIEARERLREKLPTSRSGRHRLCVRRLGPAASAVRPARALRQRRSRWKHTASEAIPHSTRAEENVA